ncbi:uncharacterized protein LOC143363389 [Halictus rubicundus]|uniref:uncharacterized protein LOC143363389 n=1 Tax=Halictus rubicundus TaxID=77578 RepID=UPI0040372F0E
MRYLGLVIDGRWRFEEHFELLAPRLEKTAAALARLLPNVGGPDLKVRRLYTEVVRSIALYGAPVWHRSLEASTPSRKLLERVRRRLALRVIRGYRTISTEAWCRRRGRLTFRLTQVLSGHGCFGEYLQRMGREPTAQCHHCGEDVDTARHTLEECPAWAGPRRVLRAAVGGWDLALSTVVDHMVGSVGSWKAVASFCDEVIQQKEAAERARERDPGSARRAFRSLRDPAPGSPVARASLAYRLSLSAFGV